MLAFNVAFLQQSCDVMTVRDSLFKKNRFIESVFLTHTKIKNQHMNLNNGDNQQMLVL